MLEIVNTTTIVTELGLDPADERHAAFAAGLRAGLARVEDELQEVLRSPGDPDLTEAATHLVRAGGKRLRPLVVSGKCRSNDAYHSRVLAGARIRRRARGGRAPG